MPGADGSKPTLTVRGRPARRARESFSSSEAASTRSTAPLARRAKSRSGGGIPAIIPQEFVKPNPREPPRHKFTAEVPMRKLSLSLLFLAASTAASANTVTLTAAASVQGQALFKSDVRVFNRNATSSISVHATYYYCSAGTCGLTSELDVTVPPRTAKAFDDIVGTLFQLPNTQGAIEFSTPGDDLVVTSRLYSENAGGSFGQFVPGLEDSDAFPFSVLTSLQENADFRTNFVAFNLNDSDSVSAVS